MTRFGPDRYKDGSLVEHWMSNYTLSADGKSITCRQCGLTSYNPNDVDYHYCGNCHVFHDGGAREFDCVECGRHIVSFGNLIIQAAHPDTCAECWSIPRWFDDPEIARAIDPDNTLRPRI